MNKQLIGSMLWLLLAMTLFAYGLYIWLSKNDPFLTYLIKFSERWEKVTKKRFLPWIPAIFSLTLAIISLWHASRLEVVVIFLIGSCIFSLCAIYYQKISNSGIQTLLWLKQYSIIVTIYFFLTAIFMIIWLVMIITKHKE